MPWMPYLLATLYPAMDEIIIVEGALESAAPFADSNGHSTDGTLAAIRAFPDPQCKIKLVQQSGFWQDKNHMGAAGAGHVTGDWLWQFDSDEFMHTADIRQIQRLLMNRPHIGGLTLHRLDFFDGFDAIIQGGRYHNQRYCFPRIWRWGPGYRYVHLPPIVFTREGWDARRLPRLAGGLLARRYGIYLYHYGHVSPAQVAQKMAIYAPLAYAQRDMGRNETYIRRWQARHFTRFTPWRVDRHPRPMSWLVPFRGTHPRWINHLQTVSHLALGLETRPAIRAYLAQPWRWRTWALVGSLDAWPYAILYRRLPHTLKRLLRPFVRLIKARFLGFDYSAERAQIPPRR